MNSKNILYNMIEEKRGQILLDSKEEKMIIIRLNGEELSFRIIDNTLRIDGEIYNKKLINIIKDYLLE
jgi:stalled ribosome rescue protein Dom34